MAADQTTRDERLRRVTKWAKLLDAQFAIPGTQIRFGLDALIGLLPVAGDLVMVPLSLVIVFQAARAGARLGTIVRMLLNIALDLLIGAIPLLGDVFDVLFKANVRNARLLEKELEQLDGG